MVGVDVVVEVVVGRVAASVDFFWGVREATARAFDAAIFGASVTTIDCLLCENGYHKMNFS